MMDRLSMSLVPAIAIGALIGAGALLAGCGSSGVGRSTAHSAPAAGDTAPATTSTRSRSAAKSRSSNQNTPTTATPNGSARSGAGPGGTAGGASTSGGGKAVSPTPAQIEKLLKESSANDCMQLGTATANLSAKQTAEVERLCAKLH